MKRLLLALALTLPLFAQSHDFDFEIGTWKTHVKRLVKPLTGSTAWVEMEGITKGVSSMTNNAAALTSIVSSTVGSPLIKVAAFSYGVRSTIRRRLDSAAGSEARRSRSGRNRRDG